MASADGVEVFLFLCCACLTAAKSYDDDFLAAKVVIIIQTEGAPANRAKKAAEILL